MVRIAMLAALILGGVTRVMAQETYVITNGDNKWLERLGSAWTEDVRGVMDGTWEDFYKAVPDPEDLRLLNRKGQFYMKLDLTNPANPKLDTSTRLTPTCVWTRTGRTGYYFQEHTIEGVTYYYYLLGSSAQGLRVNRIAAGEALDNTTYWYDWDFGLALQEDVVNNGWTSSRYYWVMLDSTNFTWRLSYASCYERPETRIYENASGTIWRYYDNMVVSSINHARGHGGLYMPITREYTPKSVTLPDGKGLTALTESASEVPYQGSTVITPTITFSPSGDPASVVEGYYTYVEETERTHISNNWQERDNDEAGRAGVPTFMTKYFWDSAPDSAQDAVPTAQPETMRLSDLAKVVYTFPSKAMRYIDTVRGADNVLTVTCRLLPRTDIEVTVTATDYYNVSGSTQLAEGNSRTVTFTLKAGVSREPVTQVDAPLIGGDIFGGGRMADVGGDTKVTIHNCDSVRAVFGGNDIAGTVTGGSIVTIGTDSATVSTGTRNIYIGTVYGGGNGYYKYEGIATVDASHTTFNGRVRPFGTTDEYPTPVVSTVFTDGVIPAIGTTHVVMNSDLAHVDSIFGGAKNAFITGDGAGVVTVDQNAGVVYAEFGGNNFGGALTGTGAVTTVNVNGTKEKTDAVVANGHDSGFGYDFGVRYLFGGGNLVDAVSVALNINGGMVDTCFAGGNRATVTTSASCVVNTPAAAGLDPDKKIFVNPKGLLTGDSWVGGKGIYNVRNLFAGNNMATMEIIPAVSLVRGGIGTVYGGGNKGDMAYDENLNTTLFPIDINPATDSINLPSKIGTYVIVNGSELDIDYLYGGCRMSNVLRSTYVRVNAGNVGTVFGGCNISGDVGTTNYYEYDDRANVFGTYVVISGTANIRANVFAGANGNYHCNTNAVLGVNSFAYTDAMQFGDADGDPFDPYDDYVGGYIPTHNNTNLIIRGGTVQGNVYGGANLANVGFKELKYIRRDNTAGTDNQVSCPRQHGSVHLTMNGGRVKGNMFGGGNMASIYGLSYLVVQGKSIIDGSLYAGNDRVGTVEAFGAYTSKDGVTDDAFTASDGAALNSQDGSTYNAKYSTYLLLKGSPAIGSVYGSGNGAYDYDGTRTWYPAIQLCEGSTTNRPIQSSTFIDINTSGINDTAALLANDNKIIDTVFGGGNGVSVENSVTILLHCENNSDYYVGTIFGGNNRDDMNTCVPTIDLNVGKVRTVYGGGNAGSMNNMRSFTDICDEDVDSVSTYIVVNSSQAAIDTIYGGCNVADVNGMAYIDIRQTSADGIGWVYGGNNVSGSVNGNTRIDVNGGVVNNIYGGSNGYYDYRNISGHGYTVYKFGHLNDANYIVDTGTTGVPNVSYANINIYGGTINNNVYGGGRMGDCDSTLIVVNDRYAQQNCGAAANSATINGTIYGGGEGIWWNLDQPRRGIVKNQTKVELYHASVIGGRAKAYGGGRGGDVYRKANLTVHEDWDIPFDEIYGGCWGSDLFGTANLTLYGKNTAGDTVARRVFGGNDFTGNVTECVLNIHSGNYGKIYGAGNGDSLYVYDTGAYTMYPLQVPNAESVTLNFHGGNVNGNIYGGGCLGTTMKYKFNPDGTYLAYNNRRVPDTTYGYQLDANEDTVYVNGRKVKMPSQAYTSPSKYAYIVVNFHGGTAGNIYAGGEGKDKLNVYGLKILNMDGGMVYESVYGGSERVDDGYPSECDSIGYYLRKDGPSNFTHTTMRPSSIVNIVGGTVTTSVYGGGYLGDAYGSTYVNIGQSAVDSCPAWTDSLVGLANTDSAYWMFKPGVYKGYSAAQTPSNLYLELSVYGGANWGSNVGSSFFTKPGIFGGKTRVTIDGNGYNTGDPSLSGTVPKMNIKESVIGSGTSALAGDVNTRIDIRNYGYVNNACESTKDILSVQRADELWLRNTAINYTGTTDAVSAYPSQNFSINRVDTINTCGYNMLDIDALLTNVEMINYYKDSYYGYARPTDGDYVDHQTLYYTDADQCSSPTLCKQLEAINRTTRKYTAIVIRNGVNIDVTKDGGSGYGAINGFAYLLAENGTNAMVTARAKSAYLPEGMDGHVDDGGFMSTCATENKVTENVSAAWQLVWDEAVDDADRLANGEYPYDNYSSTYRVWSVGQGRRSRYAVILAHTNYKKLDEDKQLRTTNIVGHDTGDSLAIAYAKMILPSTETGHYYRLSQSSGIIVTEQNSRMKLADEGWLPNDWDALPETTETNVNTMGTTITAAHDAVYTTTNVLSDAGYTFGLVMDCGDNFGTSAPLDEHGNPYSTLGHTLITGNKNVSVIEDYASYKVSDQNHTSPVMDFYLTYNHDFSNTILGTVKFTLDEFDENGVSINSPIYVVLTIATIIDSFKDMEYEVLAMYNEGRTNHFTRKAVFPATLQHRDLYLKSVTWQPTDPNGNPITSGSLADGSAPDQFYLTGSEDAVISETDNNTFCIGIQPVNNISSDLTSNIGWHVITQKNLVDIHNLVKANESQRDKVSGGSSLDAVTPGTLLHPTNERGLKLGELDGRGLAALNIQLTFDGDKVYPAVPANSKGYVGRAVLELESFGPTQSEGVFHITVNVKCRDHGDTIYIASADSVVRGGHKVSYSSANLTGDNAGKIPTKYVKSFTQALNDNIYIEGDVLAILDTVRIGADGEDITIQGSDYASIPVIRYSGHHFLFPGKECAYRGTMIDITPAPGKTTSLTGICIDFIGSSVCKTKNGSAAPAPDTLIASGPIIAVHGSGATLNLQNGVTVTDNFNNYTGSDHTARGAISVTDMGVLNFVNSVDIYDNITSYNYTDGHRDNGAVYVDGGAVVLKESHAESSIHIEGNYLMPYSAGDPVLDYRKEVRRNGTLIRYAVDSTVFINGSVDDSLRANVYLTRVAPTSGTAIEREMNDEVSYVTINSTPMPTDVLLFNSRIPSNTRIGVTKWLPGPTTRDTIRVTYQDNGNFTYSELASQNNIRADEKKYTIFYSEHVNDNNIYLHQCATFRHQLAASGNLLDGTAEGDALEYKPLLSATCPTGGDTIFYRITGGLMPYTYTWSGSQSRTRTTLSNTQVYNQIAQSTPDYSGYLDAVYDTLLTQQVSMSHTEDHRDMTYNVEATDVAGCHLSKTAAVRLEKVSTAPTAFAKTGTVANWTNADTAVTANGTRQYQAINITPRVWADRTLGTVEAQIANGGQILADEQEISSLNFCEGDVIVLTTSPVSDASRFIMWDFDPYYAQTTRYVVPSASTTVTAYYGPKNYWIEHINSTTAAGMVYDANYTYDYTNPPTGAGVVNTYNGDLHIYNEAGLAWLISCINGYNGTQARTFHFNRVYLHDKTGGYDMKDYLWTPMGTLQHPFEGMLIGVGGTSIDTTGVAPVMVKNIIVDEPNLDNAGFFAIIDSARIINIALQGALIRGAQNVGTLAAQSSHSRINRVNIQSAVEDSLWMSSSNPPTTILTTHYISGGMLGTSYQDTITKSSIAAKFVGDAVYSGGGVGYGNATQIVEVTGYNFNRMRGLYVGGIGGYLNGTAPSKGGLFHSKSDGKPSVVQNNYFYVRTDGGNRRMGGVAGYAENSIIANNYIYGDIIGSEASGGVIAVGSDGTHADHNYYEASTASQPVGDLHGNGTLSDYSAFEGQGNRVTLKQNVYGVNNLTRVLNKWVREQNAAGGSFQTWRSDLNGVNNGYPVFGQPDMIPVEATVDVDGCEEVEWNGSYYTADVTLTTNVVDANEMIDSTTTINIRVHHSTHTNLTDTAIAEYGYEGYGFTVTPTEAQLLLRTLQERGSAQMVLSDTLTTMFGCDSIVTLTLTFSGNLDIPEVEEVIPAATVKVYPNPTVDYVNVEVDGLMHVELYDNEGRTLADYDARPGDNTLRLNVSYLSSGVYYLRVHTPTAVTIQKFIKR